MASEQSADDTEQEFQKHREEINEFVDEKAEQIGVHQAIRLLGQAICSRTSLYRAENAESGNPELMTLFTQDHASSMMYWAEAEIGIQDIHGLENREVGADSDRGGDEDAE